MSVGYDAEVPLVLFDGDCGLCVRSIRFIVRYDGAARFTFAPIGGKTARVVLGDPLIPPAIETVVLVEEDGRTFTRSDAAIRILRRLSFPARLLCVIGVVPRRWRDWIYGLVAAHRRRLFGPATSCPMPGGDWRRRLLE
ncbi:MAG: thiol-disulfide oxidoreductase DCC family protein [Vicinamibacterales bacterium]